MIYYALCQPCWLCACRHSINTTLVIFHVFWAKLFKVKKHKLINGCMALQDIIALESLFKDVLKNLTIHIYQVVHLTINMPSKYFILRGGGGDAKIHMWNNLRSQVSWACTLLCKGGGGALFQDPSKHEASLAPGSTLKQHWFNVFCLQRLRWILFRDV